MTSGTSPFFSITVPACNVGPFVPKTIQSLREQTFGDFEAFFVVEESKDGTLDICKKEVGDDKRFHIISLPKSGSASASRNYGMEHAVGQYMLFVDGDDWIDNDSLEKFKTIIDQQPDVDIIVSGARDYMDYGNDRLEKTGRVISLGTPGATFETGCDFLRSIDFIHYYNPHTGIMVYKGDLLRQDSSLRQAVGRLHEDDEWSYRVVLHAKKVTVAPFQHYDFRINANSVTNKRSSKTIYDRADNAISCSDYFVHGLYPKSFAKTLSRYFCLNFFWGILLRKYVGHLAKGLIPREDCYQAIKNCLGTKEQFSVYCDIAKTAGGFFLLGIPLMALARHKTLFPVAEISYRIWTNRIRPVLQRLHLA